MNTTFSYGLILAVTNIVLTLVGFFLGFQTDKMAEGTWFGWLTFVAAIVVTWLGIKAVREEAKDKALSYGKGVGSGVLINLYAGVIGSIYGVIHFTYINPSFRDYMMNTMRQKWAEAGVSDAQMETMEKGFRFMMSPVMASISGLIMTVLFGLVVALVVSAFLKRAPQPAFEVEPPAA
jgi:uncharacterized membrane protein YeaQ/YmgE (transglycosylase-associated protein family)